MILLVILHGGATLGLKLRRDHRGCTDDRGRGGEGGCIQDGWSSRTLKEFVIFTFSNYCYGDQMEQHEIGHAARIRQITDMSHTKYLL